MILLSSEWRTHLLTPRVSGCADERAMTDFIIYVVRKAVICAVFAASNIAPDNESFYNVPPVLYCALDEAVPGKFDMLAKELEAYAVKKAKKHKENHAMNDLNWYHKQMANNYDKFRTAQNEREKKSRAKNPQLYKDLEENLKKNIEEKKHYCKDCDLAFPVKHNLADHLKSDAHFRMVNNINTEHWCTSCNKGFANKQNLKRHNKSDRHMDNVAAADAAAAADTESGS